MQDVIKQLNVMSNESIEKWINTNMYQNAEIADDFIGMVANIEARREEAEKDKTVYLGEVEENYDWGLRYFFLMLNGADEEDARDMAEWR